MAIDWDNMTKDEAVSLAQNLITARDQEKYYHGEAVKRIDKLRTALKQIALAVEVPGEPAEEMDGVHGKVWRLATDAVSLTDTAFEPFTGWDKPA